MKSFCIFAMVLFALCINSFAEPIQPGRRQAVVLPDGSVKELAVIGNENFVGFLDEETQRVYTKGKNGYVEVTREEVRKRMRRADSKVMQTKKNEFFTEGQVVGKKKVLIIPVQFPDKPFTELKDLSIVTDFCNSAGYNGAWSPNGSVREYFLNQSNGAFEPFFEVTKAVTVSKPYGYYGRDIEGSANDYDKINEWVVEAVNLADNDVDFSRYDWDGDGVADHICLLYAGTSQSSGNDPDVIWAHKGDISHLQCVIDDVLISDYACFPEMRAGNKNTEIIAGIGTLCHEFGHCLGLPDFSDGEGVWYGTSRYDLMGIGTHNVNGTVPAGLTCYGKMLLGWQQPIVLNDSQSVEAMRPLSEGGDFYLMRNDGHYDEFFLLENRQQLGFDSGIIGHGMLIYHVDADMEVLMNFPVNNSGKLNYEHCKLMVADNSTHTGQAYDEFNHDVKGDFYPMGNNRFGDDSTPAAMLFYPNNDGSFLLHKEVSDIRENSDGTIGFTFTNSRSGMGVLYSMKSNATMKSYNNVVVEDEIRCEAADYEGGIFVQLLGINGTDVTILHEETRKVSIEQSTTYNFTGEYVIDLSLYDAGGVVLGYLEPGTFKARILSQHVFDADSYKTKQIVGTLTTNLQKVGRDDQIEFSCIDGYFQNCSTETLTDTIGVLLTHKATGKQQFVVAIKMNVQQSSVKKISIQSKNIIGIGTFTAQMAYIDSKTGRMEVLKCAKGATNMVEFEVTENYAPVFVASSLYLAGQPTSKRVSVTAVLTSPYGCENENISAFIKQGNTYYGNIAQKVSIPAGTEKVVTFDITPKNLVLGEEYSVGLYSYTYGWLTVTHFNKCVFVHDYDEEVGISGVAEHESATANAAQDERLASGIDDIFDLSGRRMNALHKGLNIIRKKNGSIRKVMMP